MSRPLVVLLAFAVLSPGCVPVTEPVGDIDKAEPDKNLVGKWVSAAKPKEEPSLKIEAAPEVKGNPKGLMVMTPTGYPFPGGKEPEVQLYFFVSTVGKGQYGSILVDADHRLGLLALEKEGEYARWSKGAGRRYVVFRYDAGKDGLTINSGDEDAFRALMKDENIPRDDKKVAPQTKDQDRFYYKTPAGWLAKYLDKQGHEKLFPAAKDTKYAKEK